MDDLLTRQYKDHVPGAGSRDRASSITVRKLEYPITEHCNLRCIHCDHASPLLRPWCVNVQQYRQDLEAAAQVLHAQEFCVLGGEPLLHPDLLRLLSIAREVRIGDKITLVTNGTMLHKVESDLWKMIDTLWLSVYPGVKLRPSLEDLHGICSDNGVALDVHRTSSFTRRLLYRKNPNPESVAWIYERCKLAHEWSCYSIYVGRFFKCSPAPFMQQRLALNNIAFHAPADGVSLHDNPFLRNDIEQYLLSNCPLEACAYCLGSSGFDVPHRQLRKQEILDVHGADQEEIESMIDRALDTGPLVEILPYR